MTSPVHPNIPVTSLNWSQVPGSASVVAAAPDGTLWALSDKPAGGDKNIWHYANGAWTNISRLATPGWPREKLSQQATADRRSRIYYSRLFIVLDSVILFQRFL